MYPDPLIFRCYMPSRLVQNVNPTLGYRPIRFVSLQTDYAPFAKILGGQGNHFGYKIHLSLKA